MKLRVALAQINPKVGDVAGNLEKHIRVAGEAITAGAQLVVFPELSLCGYPPLDLLLMPAFVDNCLAALDALLPLSQKADLIVGCPWRHANGQDMKLLNTAVLLSKGKKMAVAKTLLPTYDVFDEARYFMPATQAQVVHTGNYRIAITICEDLWASEYPTYQQMPPMNALAGQKPHFAVNIAASPFSRNQQQRRLSVLKQNCTSHKLPLIYVNQTGANTDLIFDGNSMALQPDGSVALRLASFTEECKLIDFDGEKWIPNDSLQTSTVHAEAMVETALTRGITDFFVKQGFSKAILGLSGGVDSALVAVLACRALGADNVLGVMMPSQFSSQHSITDARKLAANLGMKVIELPIQQAVDSMLDTLQPYFADTAPGLAEENLQARIRGNLLMSLSNKHGYLLLNTSNKSELATGYGTLYGDMCGSLSVIGDLYKTEVYALCKWINSKGEIIPENILTKAPSAELRPGQKDSDSLPAYEELDAILRLHIEGNVDAATLEKLGYKPETIRLTQTLLKGSEHKRRQFAPILRISDRAFGSGRVIPIVASH